MYHLESWEINDILDNIEYLDRNSWEQTKLQTWTIAQVNSRKPIDKESFIKFAWNKNTTDKEKDVEITNADILRLQTLAKKFENNGNT